MGFYTGTGWERTLRWGASVCWLLCAGRLSAQYVGSDACRQCHPTEYQKQSASPHARALAPADIAGPGEWAFGAGQKAITYVTRASQNWYVERGLSFYASLNALAPTPGHQGASDLPYPALAAGASIARCFRCHSTGQPRLANDGAIQPAEYGVRCESCHGPGAGHIQAGGDPAAIGNPKRLNAVEINRFCGACHRRPPEPAEVNDGRVGVALKFDWSNRWNVRHQPAYLTQSTCFRASAGKLSCITCHDPHTAGTLPAASYDQRCRSCHDNIKHRLSTPEMACVTCHMPNVPASAELGFTNHWIGVYANGNALIPAHDGRTLPPLQLPPTAEGKLDPPNDVSTLRPLFEQAIVEEQNRPGSPDLAHRFELLGLFLKESGKPAAGEQALRQALELNRVRNSSETPSNEIELALLLQIIGKSREAVELLRKASTGADARIAALGYESLARLDPVNAASYYEKAAVAERIAWGRTSPRVATQLSNQALALQAKGEKKKATEGLLRQALAIQEKALGRGHYQTAATLSNLATVMQSLGKMDDAEKLSREAFSIFSQRLPHSMELAAVCANLADILNQKGDRTGAIGFLRLAIANDEAAGGGDNVETAADLAGLARLLQQTNDSTGANALFRRALSIYESRLGPESAQAREVKRSLETAVR